MAPIEYEVLRTVRHEYATPRGLVSVEFDAGRVSDPSEDERFVLEFVLIPDGLARRVPRKERSK